MKLAAVVPVLLSCGGATPSVTVPAPPATNASAEPAEPAPAPVDPLVEARRAYTNPGGMWMPQQMTLPGHAAAFTKLGVKIDPAKLADPLSAPLAGIVRLGGCSASFVSPDGLIVTNHHCVQTALQVNSTPENNLVENGFLAKARTDEVSAGPAQRVYVAQAFTDVSDKIRSGLEAIKDPVARKDEQEKRVKAQLAACEKDRPSVRCNVAQYFRGGTYVLIEELEIRDVRLVYAPARSVGNYGGEVDNWRWPRHTGDFSFYRAYVGKDGQPADHSPDNVPFKPAHYLKVSAKGVAANDFVMIAGFPGRTTRTKTALEVQHDVEWAYPYYIEYFKQLYAIADAHLKDPGQTAIKAGVMKQSVQNRLEKTSGVLKGLTANESLLKTKAAADLLVKQLVTGKPAQASLDKLEKLILDEQRTARADFDRSTAFGGSKLLSTAMTTIRWSEERPKPDADRKAGFQDRDLKPTLAAQKQQTKQYDAILDRAQFRLALIRAAELPAADRPWLAQLLGVGRTAKIDQALIDKTLEGWYRDSKLADEAVRLDLLQNATKAKLAASTDPFIKAARRVWPMFLAQEKKADAHTGEALLVAPVYADALREVQQGLLASDANGTLRITYGTVKAFTPTDAAFTVGSQILAKDTGKDPFDAPARLLAAIKAKQFGPYAMNGELPVNFLSDLDTTGGNSGSAVLNDKGELVGLNFDSTIEGVASDVVFDGSVVRKIHVDARYMLFMMDKVDGADHLISEMGLKPSL